MKKNGLWKKMEISSGNSLRYHGWNGSSDWMQRRLF